MTTRSGSPRPKRRRRGSLDRKRARTKVVVLVMAGLMVLSLVGAALGAMIGGQQAAPEPVPEPDPATIEPAAVPCPPADDAPEVDSRIYDEPPLAEPAPGATYLVTFETSCGAFTVEVDQDGAPVAAANLIGLVDDGYYDGVVFHRVVAGFVVQTGDPAGTGCGQEDCSPEGFDPDAPTYPGYSFEDELDTAEERFAEVRDELAQLLDAELAEDVDLDLVPGGYPRGTVAMANRGPDTNGSQFFVAQGDPTLLPAPAFTVLGHVVDGMDVVDRIAGQPVDALDRPLEPVVILAVQVEQH